MRKHKLFKRLINWTNKNINDKFDEKSSKTKIGNEVDGGAISAILDYSSNRLDIKDCKFASCKAQDSFGGALNV
jgi:hypothetical protein